MSKVMIYAATYENVYRAVEEVFELFPLELQGKKVFVKPNVLRASEAKEGFITHPEVLRAVVEKVKTTEAGSIVVSDNPGLFGYEENEESFKMIGLMEAARAIIRTSDIIHNRLISIPILFPR
jgi:uncharacterized protein (DUF362 family)